MKGKHGLLNNRKRKFIFVHIVLLGSKRKKKKLIVRITSSSLIGFLLHFNSKCSHILILFQLSYRRNKSVFCLSFFFQFSVQKFVRNQCVRIKKTEINKISG